ncbi:MAG: hypothetical protein CSA35_07875 [Dethiosulfovibrio peptidovorans]|nr:MAG: hypothetical protein CSA35_07875 [Dethiosulfovibrio peptidovorans]
MTVSVFVVSSRGEQTGQVAAQALNGQLIRPPKEGLRSAVAQAWPSSEAIVLVGSIGVAVRVVAPLLRDKASDPAVLVITEDGSMVIPITGAHLGGGTDLARRLAATLDADLILTTSTDRIYAGAPDLLCHRWGWSLIGRKALIATNGALLDGRDLSFWIDPDEVTPPFPERYVPGDNPDTADVVVSPRQRDLSPHQVQLIPPSLVAGIGCRRGTPLQTIREILETALSAQGFLIQGLREIRTIALKADESGLSALAQELNVPLLVVDDDEIRTMEGPFTPSASQRHLGLPGVAEPCAASAGSLLGPRVASDGVTVALARYPARIPGHLTVVGLGPGGRRYLTAQAKETIQDADVVVGYHLYVDQVPSEWLRGKRVERYDMGQEEARVRSALDLADRGYRVALVSGGDPILFGMAGLTRNMSGSTAVTVVPGLSAAQVAGATLGAPYANGLILLSLSDYLQPWKAIERALDGAVSTGLTVALYNPVRRALEAKLNRVKKAYEGREGQTVWLIRDAGRPDESIVSMDLKDLSAEAVDMRTLILLPGTDTMYRNGLLVDTRGYDSERTRT